MTKSFLRRPALLLFAALLLAVVGKLYTLAEYGPLRLGDNYHYIAAAKEILADDGWMSAVALDRTDTPPTLYRPIAYSLTIAAAMAVAGDQWSLAVMAGQAVLSLGAGLLVLRMALAAGFGWPGAAALFVLHQWSIPLSTDAIIMEDAIMGALGTAALCVVVLPVVRGGVPSTLRLLAAGTLMGAMFFLREVFHFCAPLMAVAAFAVVLRHRGWRPAVLAALVLVAPVMLASAGMKAWNQHRVGAAIAGTGGQTAYAYALAMAMRYDPSIAGGEEPMQIALRETNRTFDYEDARAANMMMFTRFGMDSVQQLRAGERLFWRTLATNPAPLVRAALVRLRLVQQATLFAGPLTRIDDLDWWASRFDQGWRVSKERFLATRDLSDLTLSAAFNMGLRVVTRAVGLAVFAAFTVGVPLAWLLLRRRLGGAAHAMLVVWGLWWLLVAMYVPVSFEVRYMGALIGPALVSAALVLANLRALAGATRGALGRVGLTSPPA